MLIAALPDHPRRCGENITDVQTGYSRQGSPPQVRGKRKNIFVSGRKTRITPAGAGKTGRAEILIKIKHDHPRRCGENSLNLYAHRCASGSPPQVRGKLLLSTITTLQPRITPAGAGKTRHCGTAKQNGTDHPRRCGENLIPAFVKLSLIGSPPQVRGKPKSDIQSLWRVRITPAGAGKTAAEL